MDGCFELARVNITSIVTAEGLITDQAASAGGMEIQGHEFENQPQRKGT
jgi:hypothetical protein